MANEAGPNKTLLIVFGVLVVIVVLYYVIF